MIHSFDGEFTANYKTGKLSKLKSGGDGQSCIDLMDKNWLKYEHNYLTLLKERNIAEDNSLQVLKEKKCCLLCSEPSEEKCHRRLLAEFLSKNWDGVNIIHL